MSIIDWPTNFGEFSSASEWAQTNGGGPTFDATAYATNFFSNGGGKAFRWGSGSQSWTRSMPATLTEGILYFRTTRLSFSQNITLMNLSEGLTDHIIITWLQTGVITVTAGGAVRITTAATYASPPYHIALYFKVADAGGALELYIDGVSVGTFAGDTKNGGTTGIIDNVSAPSSSTISYITDYMMHDLLGTEFNSFQGPVRMINSFTPTEGASGQQFTPLSGSDNGAMLDDAIGVHDGDSTYCESNTAGHVDALSYSSSDFSGITGSVKGAVHKTTVKAPDGGAHTWRNKCKKGGTTTTGTTRSITSAYTYLNEAFAKDPSTAAAWASIAAACGAEYLYELVS